MSRPYRVYGSAGSGSVPVVAALEMIGAPYKIIGDSEMRKVASNPAVLEVNPLGQVPVLVLPDGEVVTESAAILIYLADQHPEAKLAPAQTDSRRPAFLRWMAYISSAIYSLAWIRADPMRLLADQEQAGVVQQRIADRRADCWRHMDNQIEPARFLLGQDLGVLDLYVTTVSRWSPGRRRFYHEAPRMGDVVRRVDADPRLTNIWNAQFPFFAGWEG